MAQKMVRTSNSFCRQCDYGIDMGGKTRVDCNYYLDTGQRRNCDVGWCLSNPKNRKTRSGAKRFLNGWLSRSQNSARPEKKTGAKPTGFSNFQQRDYDFDALERELLESQKG